MQKQTLGDIIGEELVDDFSNFDLSVLKEVIDGLSSTDAIDFSHAELLQQKALYGANLMLDFLGKLVKTTNYLESKISSVKNKTALEYKAPNGEKTTADMKKQAGESAPEVESLSILLAKAKGAKAVLEKKYDIMIKSHYFYKEICQGQKQTIPGYKIQNTPEGW